MFALPSLTFNLILFGLLAICIGLGIIFGENRLKFASYGVFVGFFVLLVSSETVLSDMAGKTSLPIGTAKLVFVLALSGVLFLGSAITIRKPRSNIRSIPLAVLTALFAVGFGVSFLPAKIQDQLTTDFNLAALVFNARFFIMLGLIAWLIVIQFLREKKDDDDKKKK